MFKVLGGWESGTVTDGGDSEPETEALVIIGYCALTEGYFVF